jgi:hypothetical protein
MHRHSRPESILIAVGCAAAIAGCGSSGQPNRAGAGAAGQAVRFASCMRSNGVPNFPDPSTSGNSVSVGGSGVDFASPAFKAAQSACSHLLGGGSGTNQPSATVRRQLLALSRCMRAHGVSGFPDPTTARPFGVSNLIFAGGLYLGIPIAIDANSPVFRHAAKACAGPGSIL